MVMTITNNKVAGFVPRWAPFRGFSLLFDNPGESVIAVGDRLLKAHCVPGDDLTLALYAGLADFLSELDPNRLTNDLLFCPLPVESYHVTVWDGLNDDNAAHVNSAHRARLAQFLAGLPVSLTGDAPFSAPVTESPLVAAPHPPVMLKIDHLANWSNISLVVVLAPADEASAQQIATITEQRARLWDRVEAEYGVVLSRNPYAPHVTLGYFADSTLAALDALDITQFNARLLAHVGQLVITFESISLYGFTDMTAFFKRTR